MKNLFEDYEKAILDKKESLNFRSLQPVDIAGKYVFKSGKRLLNLSSNDYLGISTKDSIRQEFLNGYKKPLSVPSARLLCANTSSYEKLEELIIKIKSGDIDSKRMEIINNHSLNDGFEAICEKAREIHLLNKQKEKLHQGSDL